MKNLIYASCIIVLISLVPITSFGLANTAWIPPTNAFNKIHTDNGTITSTNYSMPFSIVGGTNISVKSNNATHKITITNTMLPGTGTGTYNTTQANNVNINTGGAKINFINGTGCNVNVKDSHSSTQVNVTITCTGSGGTVTSVSGTLGNITSTGGNTPVINTGSNVVVTGGATQVISKNITSTGGITMSGANFTLHNKYILGNTYEFGPVLGAQLGIQPITGNTQGRFWIEPSGTSKVAGLFMSRTTTPNTNEYLSIGSDLAAANEFSIQMNPQSGTAQPINIYQSTTKLLSFDVAKTITSYVQNIWTPISDPTTAFTNAIWKSSTNTDVLKYRNAANTTTYNIMSTLNALNFTAQANRTGTSSLNSLMLGEGTRITPAVTGRVEVTASGYATQSGAADGCSTTIREGTGISPINGATLAGTQIGSLIKSTMSATTTKVPFSETVQITGLALGTAIWIELTERADTAGTCTLNNVMWSVKEI